MNVAVTATVGIPMIEGPAKLAAFIVKVLDLAASRYPGESDLESPELVCADRIKVLYGKYKSHRGMTFSFSSAADKARVEVVTQIILASWPAVHPEEKQK